MSLQKSPPLRIASRIGRNAWRRPTGHESFGWCMVRQHTHGGMTWPNLGIIISSPGFRSICSPIFERYNSRYRSDQGEAMPVAGVSPPSCAAPGSPSKRLAVIQFLVKMKNDRAKNVQIRLAARHTGKTWQYEKHESAKATNMLIFIEKTT